MIPGDVDGWSLVDIKEEGVPKVGVVMAGLRTAAAAAANLKKNKNLKIYIFDKETRNHS